MVSPPAPPDPGLPEDTSSGSPEDNFSGLYRATILPLRRYLNRLLGNYAEAEEIAHDAYARIYRQPAQKPEALLYTTARRLAINRLKRRSISPIAPTDAPLENASASHPDIPRQVIARQELELLESAINDLPTGCRNVLLLRKIEGLSHKEIGARLGIAVSTVEKQHARALRLLRTSLAAMADDDASSPFAAEPPSSS